MIQMLRALLREPALRQLSVDEVDFTVRHREILSRKPVLRGLFTDYYIQCRTLDDRHFGNTEGLRLEIGAGSSLMKETYPDVILSDIKSIPFIDLVAAADCLPFNDATIRVVYAINMFHHLPNVHDFFREMLRVLRPGGGIILVEPYYGVFARWLFRRLHESETFDEKMPTWQYCREVGVMSDANQALSYIVFVRDRRKFEELYPELELCDMRPHTHLRYLCSGGLNYRTLVPHKFEGVLKLAEALFAPLNPWLSIQQTIVLRKIISWKRR